MPEWSISSAMARADRSTIRRSAPRSISDWVTAVKAAAPRSSSSDRRAAVVATKRRVSWSRRAIESSVSTARQPCGIRRTGASTPRPNLGWPQGRNREPRRRHRFDESGCRLLRRPYWPRFVPTCRNRWRRSTGQQRRSRERVWIAERWWGCFSLAGTLPRGCLPWPHDEPIAHI